MYERFTDRARKVMQLANHEALRLGQSHLACEHILYGLVKEGDGIGGRVLLSLGLDLAKLQPHLDVTKIENAEYAAGRLPLSSFAERAISRAKAESVNLGHNYVGTEHLLLGLFCSSLSYALARNILAKHRVTEHKVRDGILALIRPKKDKVEDAIGRMDEGEARRLHEYRVDKFLAEIREEMLKENVEPVIAIGVRHKDGHITMVMTEPLDLIVTGSVLQGAMNWVDGKEYSLAGTRWLARRVNQSRREIEKQPNTEEQADGPS